MSVAQEDEDDFPDELSSSSPLASEPVASFLSWMQEDVEAADLEDWRADAARLYPMGDDELLPAMNVDINEPGASIPRGQTDDGDDDDDDEWFDDDLD